MNVIHNAQILPSKFILDHTTFRPLLPSDIDAFKRLCMGWFPVEYPDAWYQEVTQNSAGYYTVAALYKDVIIGAIVTEIKFVQDLHKEDSGIIYKNVRSRIAYIMTLGVSQEHQHNGIGSILVTNLINYVSQPCNRDIKAIYLHVLITNYEAIRFYERRQFQLHALLRGYYPIKGSKRDGFTYVLYVNGGKPPNCFSSRLQHLVCPSFTTYSLNFLQEDDDQLLLESQSTNNCQRFLCETSPSSFMRWFCR